MDSECSGLSVSSVFMIPLILVIVGVCGFVSGHYERFASGDSKVWSLGVIQEEQDSNCMIIPFTNDVFGPVELDGHGKGTGRLGRGGNSILPLISFFLILIALPHSAIALLTSQQPDAPGDVLNNAAPNQASSLLECLQVSAPVLQPEQPTCQQTLMIHTFGWSYGKPFIGEYIPPECEFNRVTFNFTVTSAGRQFDRLALMFFNDTEIFRTSTAEPTQNGIIWTYIKDMSNYQALFNKPQKIIFDLGNLVDDTYTGSWYTTLTATFFTEKDSIDPADSIIPISTRQSASNSSSGFVVPESKALSTLAIPRNTKRAVFSISACGQATEEFWWSNVLSSDTAVFGNESTLYGYSPFRELQLLIDGSLAGVAWPFPVIFTGGIVPGFWRPVVGIDAFDLKEDEIDITPFLPILSDGEEHTFEILVVGISDDGKGNGELTKEIGSNWVVTGKVFIWLDQDGSITTGTVPTITAPKPSLQLSSSAQKSANGTVKSLEYLVKVARKLLISSTLKTSTGSRVVTWQQTLKYSNEGNFTNSGNDQTNVQSTLGSDVSSSGYSKSFDYPLSVWSAYNVLSGGNFTIEAKMARGKNLQTIGDLAFPSELKTSREALEHGYSFSGASSKNWQNGTASYLSAPALKRSFGSGTTEQFYSLAGIGDSATTVQDGTPGIGGQGDTTLYRRHVLAVNDSLVLDEESMGGADKIHKSVFAQAVGGENAFAQRGIRALLGRGPF